MQCSPPSRFQPYEAEGAHEATSRREIIAATATHAVAQDIYFGAVAAVVVPLASSSMAILNTRDFHAVCNERGYCSKCAPGVGLIPERNRTQPIRSRSLCAAACPSAGERYEGPGVLASAEISSLELVGPMTGVSSVLPPV